jgi:hypothetical protein
MKQKFFNNLLIIVSLAVIASCSGKQEDMTPVQPGEMVTYKDLLYHFSFKAPKLWAVESVPGTKTTYYSSPSTETRFQSMKEGDFGAKIEVGVDTNTSKEQEAANFKPYDGVNYSAPEPTTLGGQPALKVSYSVQGDEDGLTGYRIFTDKDSLVTYFDAATFGAKRMQKYGPIFDSVQKSVQPAFIYKVTNGKIDSASMAAMLEEMKPSATFSTYSGAGFSIQYPDNFSASTMGSGVEIKGERADAMVRVDANPVDKSIDLDKYVAENAKSAVYRGAEAQNASLSGKPAKVISYGSGGATAKTYFVMSAPNVYRITVSWPNDLEAAFRPALEKSVQSFKLK